MESNVENNESEYIEVYDDVWGIPLGLKLVKNIRKIKELVIIFDDKKAETSQKESL